jgi:large repetitive protein
MKKSVVVTLAVLFLSSLFFIPQANAYVIPYEDTKARAFYVFGPDGNSLAGAEDSRMEIVIDVPYNELSSLTVDVYDPDTGNFFDWREPIYETNFKPTLNEWNTKCRFELFGEKLLDSTDFDLSPEWDRRWYRFGPYDKSDGERVGDYYRFRLVATGLKGDDQNLFRVRIYPETAESHSNKVKIRLHSKEGKEMFFYPYIPAGASSVIVDNYDLDAEGGSSTLAQDKRKRGYDIGVSRSGEWRQTVVPVLSRGGSMVYTITRGRQGYANMAFQMKTDRGEIIPIYFKKGTPRKVQEIVAVKTPEPIKHQPKPVLEKQPQCNKFTFDATKSHDPDRADLNFLWDFGDGTSSNEPVVTHIYERGGEYKVSLTVSNDSGLPCDSSTTYQNVLVNTPPIAAFSAPEAVCLTDTVNFDGSGTSDDNPENLNYSWNFGDGSRAGGEKVSHVYSKSGTYTVTLTVDDNEKTLCSIDKISKVINVYAPPKADAGRDISLCLKSLDEDYKVRLDGSGSISPDKLPLTYTWDMGDGTVLSGQKIEHRYSRSGIYNVTLVVDNNLGLSCSKSSDIITVHLNKSPLADAGEDKKVCLGEAISFDGSGSKTESGERLSYSWDFGDGNKATGAKVSHKYEKGGKYPVTLVVDDNMDTACSVSMDVSFVNVNSRPLAVLSDIKDSCVGKEVLFDASRSSDPDGDSLTYLWNFGDGTIEERASSRVKHTYKKGGSYTVSIKIDDGSNHGCSSASASSRVNINTPPVAKIDMVNLCCVDMEQKFDGSSSLDADGDNLTYTWYLGNGTELKGAKVSHAYSKPGVYKVILEVKDDSGTECNSSSTTETIKVSGSPVPVIEIR